MSTEDRQGQHLRRLSKNEFISVLADIAIEHGILYAAMPNDDDAYHLASDLGVQSSNPINFNGNNDYSLVPVGIEFKQPFSKCLNVLLYESFMTLVDAGLATPETTTPFKWGENGFDLNFSSTLAMSAILLSFDRTVERLAAMSLQNNFCDGSAISPLWLTRTLSEVISAPEPSLKSNLSVALEN